MKKKNLPAKQFRVLIIVQLEKCVKPLINIRHNQYRQFCRNGKESICFRQI